MGKLADVFAQLPSQGRRLELHNSGRQVSCTVCHQVSNEELGTRAISTRTSRCGTPRRRARDLGPSIDKGRKTIMRSVTGCADADDAIQQSELCATCHTLYTQAYNAAGQVIAHSGADNYQDGSTAVQPGRNAQAAVVHMHPCRGGRVAPCSRLRDGMHATFVGATSCVRMLNRNRIDLGSSASVGDGSDGEGDDPHFRGDGSVSIARAEVTGGALNVDVDVKNSPDKDADRVIPPPHVLHVTVRDRQDKRCRVGRINDAGLIQGNDNDADATNTSHYEQISGRTGSIYESIMGDASNVPTTVC